MIVPLAGFAALVMVVAGALGGDTWGGSSIGSTAEAGSPSTLALKDIPPLYMRLYRQAGERYGLNWAVLAAIGKVECDHGRDPSPACAREGVVNGAGAGGPMQFLASTWAMYGVDGNEDGRADRWDSADAISAAARYLRASGAPGDYGRAIFSYNHAWWYVREVEDWAHRYTAPPAVTVPAEPAVGGADLALAGQTSSPVWFVAGQGAVLDPQDGHVAMIPIAAPAVVQEMLIAGNELQGVRYGPGGHPDPRGQTEEDCSSTVNYVLYRSGIRSIGEIVRQNPLAQDYLDWGAQGPGRWVTVYATRSPTPHVFMVIAGLRLDTSHRGTDTGPNRDEDGPRWRVLDGIPTWARWSVRHPPGL
jgi:hypothetical protein